MATEDLYGLTEEVRKRATKEITGLAIEIATRLIDRQGRAPGDIELDDVQTMQHYIALRENGTLQVLKGIQPKLFNKMQREFDEVYLRTRGGTQV
jgi:hypothetical protein